jgi:hypothetical protein
MLFNEQRKTQGGVPCLKIENSCVNLNFSLDLQGNIAQNCIELRTDYVYSDLMVF